MITERDILGVGGALLIVVFFFVGVPLLKDYLSRRQPKQHQPRPQPPRWAENTQSTTPAAPVTPAPAARMSLRQWLNLVNEAPDEAPHLSIFGPSGSGKTVLAQAILADRDGQVVIIDPKPPKPGATKWGGTPYTMIDDDGQYTAIDRLLRQLRRELNTRLADAKRGIAHPPLTIVLDEYKTLRRVCADSAPDLYITISDVGRELGMRLIVLSTSRTVESLGVKGMGDTRDSHIVIEVDKQHRATLEWDDRTYQLDTQRVPELAQSKITPIRWWQAPTQEAPADRRQLLRLLNLEDSLPTQQDDFQEAENDLEKFTTPETNFQALESDSTVSEVNFPPEETAKMAALIVAGKGKTETLKAMPGYSGRKHSLYSAYYDRLNKEIRQALQSEAQHEAA